MSPAADCPFCAPREAVLEGPLVRVIEDGYPVSPGHLLVIPRRHVASYFEASAEEQQALWEMVERAREWTETRAAAEGRREPDGYNIGVNVGTAAGQTVMHLHVHLIPRFRGDMDDPRGGVRGVIPSMQRYGTEGKSP